ncbi:MAG: hypothetical protein J6U26_02855, partial [Lachnospiraceae bacterium]|nr:hypothetical protein [Lachnospiraceae bacterium]
AGLPQKAEAAEGRRELPLDDVLIRVLCTLLKGGDPGPLLKAHHILPSIAADTVNEALFDEIGDNAVLCGEDGLSLEEDYTSDLELLLGGYLND